MHAKKTQTYFLSLNMFLLFMHNPTTTLSTKISPVHRRLCHWLSEAGVILCICV